MMLDQAVTGRTFLSNVLPGNLLKGSATAWAVQGPNDGSDKATYPWKQISLPLGQDMNSSWVIDVNNKEYTDKKKLFTASKSGLACIEFSLSWISTFNQKDTAGETYNNAYTTKVNWHGFDGMVYYSAYNYMYDWLNAIWTMNDAQRMAFNKTYAEIPRTVDTNAANGEGVALIANTKTVYKDISYSCGIEFLHENDPTDASLDNICYSMNFFRWNRTFGVDLTGFYGSQQPEYQGWRLPACIMPEYFVVYFFVTKDHVYKLGLQSKWDGRQIGWFSLPSRHSQLPPNGWLIYDWQGVQVY